MKLKKTTLPVSQLYMQLVQLQVVDGEVPGQQYALQLEQLHFVKHTSCFVLSNVLALGCSCPACQAVLQRLSVMAALKPERLPVQSAPMLLS